MYELQVEGMNCQHCVGMVTKSVHTVDDKAKVEVDLVTRKVKIASGAELEKLKAAIADAGYKVAER